MDNLDSITSEERFSVAFKAVLEHEGGYTDNPRDPGGATNFGITQKELSRICNNLGLPENVKDINKHDAEKYYRSEWWDRYHFNAINSLPVACKIFDMAVNIGVSGAVKILQQTCNYFGVPIKVDSLIGGETIGAVNRLCNYGNDEEEKIIDFLVEKNQEYYEGLVKYNSKLGVFLKGWMNRAEYRGS